MITSGKSSMRMERFCSRLHAWGSHEHPSLTSADVAESGNGLLLFFRVDDFDQALLRARTLVSRLEKNRT